MLLHTNSKGEPRSSIFFLNVTKVNSAILTIDVNVLLFMRNNFSKYYITLVQKNIKKSTHDSRSFVKFPVILSIIFCLKEPTKIPEYLGKQSVSLSQVTYYLNPKRFLKIVLLLKSPIYSNSCIFCKGKYLMTFTYFCIISLKITAVLLSSICIVYMFAFSPIHYMHMFVKKKIKGVTCI